MGNLAIDCKSLSKRYGLSGPFALKDLTLQVERGEVYGFLGPNGAGKSTTIRTLLNFIQPTSGTASVLGKDIVINSVEIKRSLGYLAGEVALYGNLTGRQLLDYLGGLQDGALNSKYRSELVDRFKADLDKPIDDLSKGNRQKIGIIQAFMHRPEVVILDEPTSGLDPLMQAEFFKLVKETKQRGAAVFVSSHNFNEVQRMCDRVGFIRDGKLVAERDLSKLAEVSAHSFGFTFVGGTPLDELRKLSDVTITNHTTHHANLTIRGDLTPLFKVLVKHKVQSMEQQEMLLDELFMSFYKGGKDD